MTKRPADNRSLGPSGALRILHYGRFLNAATRHGGTRRSEQLREILERGGLQVIPVALESQRLGSRFARVLGVARGARVSPLHELAQVRRPAGLYHRAMADKSLGSTPPGLPAVWESGPGEAFYGGWAARRHGHRVVAAPQNFDSLTPGMASAWTGRNSPDWFGEELNQLHYADAVFVLSAHDRWLLSLYGVQAEVLPYHPPADIKAQLLKMRRLRSARPSGGNSVLALGTIGSEPTARGFRDLLQMLDGTSHSRSTVASIVIAGHGTERLRTDFERIGARVMGTVSEIELDELRLDARALLVHYVPAPGALTRIPEALIAGIPVIANRHAARGYEDVPGVYVYDLPGELVTLLAAELPTPPTISLPAAAEARFILSVLNPAEMEGQVADRHSASPHTRIRR